MSALATCHVSTRPISYHPTVKGSIFTVSRALYERRYSSASAVDGGLLTYSKCGGTTELCCCSQSGQKGIFLFERTSSFSPARLLAWSTRLSYTLTLHGGHALAWWCRWCTHCTHPHTQKKWGQHSKQDCLCMVPNQPRGIDDGAPRFFLLSHHQSQSRPGARLLAVPANSSGSAAVGVVLERNQVKGLEEHRFLPLTGLPIFQILGVLRGRVFCRTTNTHTRAYNSCLHRDMHDCATTEVPPLKGSILQTA